VLEVFEMGDVPQQPECTSEPRRAPQGSQGSNISIGHIGRDFYKDVETVSHTHVGPQMQHTSQTIGVQDFREEFMARLSAIQDEVARIQLPVEEQEEIEHELKGAELQAKKTPPNKAKLVGPLTNAQKVVKGIVSLSSETVTLANLIAQAIKWVTETWQNIV
jgi:hypothetical protein